MLVTALHAADMLELAHMMVPKLGPPVDNAKYFYIAAYFRTHDVGSTVYPTTTTSSLATTRNHRRRCRAQRAASPIRWTFTL